jgi:hypothetical protein
MLDAEAYAEEHPVELARLRRGEVAAPRAIEAWRVAVFLVVSAATIAAVAALYWWMRNSGATLLTIKVPGLS